MQQLNLFLVNSPDLKLDSILILTIFAENYQFNPELIRPSIIHLRTIISKIDERHNTAALTFLEKVSLHKAPAISEFTNVLDNLVKLLWSSSSSELSNRTVVLITGYLTNQMPVEGFRKINQSFSMLNQQNHSRIPSELFEEVRIA